MDMTQYQGQAIACLNEMLGFEISDKPDREYRYC